MSNETLPAGLRARGTAGLPTAGGALHSQGGACANTHAV
jgi:hypothetical protein